MQHAAVEHELRGRIMELEAALQAAKAEVQSGRDLISKLQAALEGKAAGNGSSSLPQVVKRRRTCLRNVAGEACDYVEILASQIKVSEVRAKVAEARNLPDRRVEILSNCGGAQPLEDEAVICHEVVASDSQESVDFRSTGDPYTIVVLAKTRTVWNGRAKCTLKHHDEYNVFQDEDWDKKWVDLAVEEKDLGRGNNIQLRIFVGDVDLVCYGSLKNPDVRQLETWGNKVAGSLELKVYKEKSEKKKLHKLTIKRYYVVEKGECKYNTDDTSEIWFKTEAERDDFVTVYREWERKNPTPSAD